MGFSDDYAQMARAALTLWEVSGENRFLEDAKAWTRTLNSQFWNEMRGGYNFVRDGAEPLIVRMRMIYDAPTPDAIRKMVMFQERNLVVEDADFWAPDSFDIVFCRNVIMYFTQDVARTVIARAQGPPCSKRGYQTSQTPMVP